MKCKKFIIVALVLLVAISFSACDLLDDMTVPEFKAEDITRDNVVSLVDSLKIDVRSQPLIKGEIPEKTDESLTSTNNAFMYEMPDIDNYEPDVKGNGDLDIEIFLPLEENGGSIRLFIDVAARQFNDADIKLSGSDKKVSVTIRCLEASLAEDFIKMGQYFPKGYISANELYGILMEENGIAVNNIARRLVGNTMGIVIENEKYSELLQKYGNVTIDTVVKANMAGDLSIGYTNPTNNPTGLNFVVSMLAYFDASNPFSMEATTDFSNFQNTVSSVSYSTEQMKQAVKSGLINAFVIERQAYENDESISNDFKFLTFGLRHDYPLYSIGDVSQEEIEALQSFAQFFETERIVEEANMLGFNKNEGYVSKVFASNYSDGMLTEILKFWKQEKASGKKISVMFVADTSGSMSSNKKLPALKKSLKNAMQYIGAENKVGLMSYTATVFDNVPISEFTIEQQEYFVGAINGWSASGGTATNNALLIALKRLDEELQKDADIKPLIILLSDGHTENGYSLSKVQNLIKAFNIPIYTIGYEANIEELEKISDMTGGVFINASSDDVGYILKTLFNAEM